MTTMRRWNFVLVVYSILLFGGVNNVILGALVGIDLGSELFKVGTASPGRPFEIVLNVHSKRKTPSAVSFVEKTREFGEAALVHATKEPSDVLLLLTSLLGLNSTSSEVNEFKSRSGRLYPLNIEPDENRGTISLHLTRRNISISAEEVTANLLQFITKTVGEFHGNTKTVQLDAVLTVPNRYTMRQRQALHNAATIANINVLGFVRVTSAATLHHLRDLPANYTGTKLFIDMGAWRTQACLVEYNTTSTKPSKRKLSSDVIYCDETDQIGGRHFDLKLANAMVEKAEEKFKTPLPSRSLQRLLQQAIKTKLVLSANKRADLFVEGLYDDKDFHSAVTREEFESLIEPMLTPLGSLIDRTLKKANFTKNQLDGVEVVGGGWRVPRVQQELAKIMQPFELGQHVNGDEGSVLGATLIAANSSAAFRIQDTKFSDPSAFGYLVRLKNSTEEAQEWKMKELIRIGGRFGGFRTLSTKSCSNIIAELHETTSEGKQTLLSTYEISGVKEACESKYKDFGIAKVSLVFSTPSTGIVTLDRVAAQWEETYMIPDPKTATTTITPPPKDDNTSTGAEQTTTPTAAAKAEEPRLIEQTRKHTLKCKVLTTEQSPKPMTETQIEEAKKRLNEFEAIDAMALKLAKSRNNLESFVYSTRDELGSLNIMEVSMEDSRKQLKEHLDEVENWLYDDGVAASIEEIEKRLNSLKSEFAPMVKAANEMKSRITFENVINEMKEKVQKSLSSEILEKIELNQTHITKFQSNWNSFITWYDEKKKEQETKKGYEEPAYQTNDAGARLHKLSKELENLFRSAKLKVVPTIEPNSTTVNATTTDFDQMESIEASNSSTHEVPEVITTPEQKEFSKSSLSEEL